MTGRGVWTVVTPRFRNIPLHHRTKRDFGVGIKMRNHVAAMILSTLCCLDAHAKSNRRETVDVIENVPSTASYDWQIGGRASVTCSGSTCSSYFTPPSSGTQVVQGAVLKLLRSDSSIVIVQCIAKGRLGASMLLTMATGDAGAPIVYRDCRMPESAPHRCQRRHDAPASPSAPACGRR